MNKLKSNFNNALDWITVNRKLEYHTTQSPAPYGTHPNRYRWARQRAPCLASVCGLMAVLRALAARKGCVGTNILNRAVGGLGHLRGQMAKTGATAQPGAPRPCPPFGGQGCAQKTNPHIVGG